MDHQDAGQGTIKVFLADDNLIVREGVRALIDRHGDLCVVGMAADYDEVVSGTAATGPQVLVTDIRMPPAFQKEGIDAAKEVCKRHPGTGVVVLSQYEDPEYAVSLLAEGSAGYGYLLKDHLAAGNQLADAIRVVATGGTALDPVIVEALVRPVVAPGGLLPAEEKLLSMIAEGKPIKAIAATRRAPLRRSMRRYRRCSSSWPRVFPRAARAHCSGCGCWGSETTALLTCPPNRMTMRRVVGNSRSRFPYSCHGPEDATAAAWQAPAWRLLAAPCARAGIGYQCGLTPGMGSDRASRRAKPRDPCRRGRHWVNGAARPPSDCAQPGGRILDLYRVGCAFIREYRSCQTLPCPWQPAVGAPASRLGPRLYTAQRGAQPGNEPGQLRLGCAPGIRRLRGQCGHPELLSQRRPGLPLCGGQGRRYSADVGVLRLRAGFRAGLRSAGQGHTQRPALFVGPERVSAGLSAGRRSRAAGNLYRDRCRARASSGQPGHSLRTDRFRRRHAVTAMVRVSRAAGSGGCG